jgi:hypothetical protein
MKRSIAERKRKLTHLRGGVSLSKTLKPLGPKDVPKRFVIDGRPFYIRTKTPLGYMLEKKPFAKGGHNEAFRATYGSSSKKQYLFRLNTDDFDSNLELEIASEVGYSIRFAHHGIAPKVYDYGYSPTKDGQPGFYWQVLEIFDDSLYGYLEKASRVECARTRDSIERQLVQKFSKMAELGSFCYDIHPRNVVVRKNKEGKIELSLIDFDHTFCISSSRIHTGLRGNGKTRAKGKGKLPTYSLSANNLLFALLLVFSSNTRRKCGVLYFQQKLKSMLHGNKTYLIKGGGPVSLAKVVSFLSTSIAQGKDSTVTIMRWWNPMKGERATVPEFVEYVLGR